MYDLLKEANTPFLLLEHPNMHRVAMHGHAFLELTYILSGTAEHTLDGKTVTLTARDYFIVDYGSRHAYRAKEREGFTNLDCLFLPEFVDPALRGAKSLRTVLEHYLLHFTPRLFVQNPAHICFRDEDGTVLRLLRKMQAEADRKAAGHSEMIRCCLIELLILTMRKIDDAEIAASDQTISGYVIAYLEKHYAEPVTLNGLAKQMNYTLPYVSKVFREETGVSFVHYLQNYRVMQGCRLLSCNRSLSEAAEDVGYRDAKFFAALIKRYTGLPPSAFRKKS